MQQKKVHNYVHPRQLRQSHDKKELKEKEQNEEVKKWCECCWLEVCGEGFCWWFPRLGSQRGLVQPGRGEDKGVTDVMVYTYKSTCWAFHTQNGTNFSFIAYSSEE